MRFLNSSSDGKEFACNAGDLGSIPMSGRSPGEGNAIHSSILAWRILWTDHGVTKCQTRLGNYHFSIQQCTLNSLEEISEEKHIHKCVFVNIQHIFKITSILSMLWGLIKLQSHVKYGKSMQHIEKESYKGQETHRQECRSTRDDPLSQRPQSASLNCFWVSHFKNFQCFPVPCTLLAGVWVDPRLTGRCWP